MVLYPASDALFMSDHRAPSMSYADYFVRSGRAVLYPIYEHTYGRGSSLDGDDNPDGTIEHRDQMIRWAREMRRSIDYAVTRPDIDTTRLAFAGASWGGRAAGVLLAVEPRFKAAVLNVPGLSMLPMRPEEDPVNFLPRIRIPVLMLSGQYDSVFPLELSQKPFFRLLGTPPAKKRHVIDEGGHFLPRPMMMRESLAWLDRLSRTGAAPVNADTPRGLLAPRRPPVLHVARCRARSWSRGRGRAGVAIPGRAPLDHRGFSRQPLPDRSR